MKYQALVFDLDGTAIPKRRDGMPSPAVIAAVQAAKQVCHVSVATGRPYEMCEPVLTALGVDDFCILNGGAHVYSRKTDTYEWKQEIAQPLLREVFAQLKDFSQYEVADEKRMDHVLMSDYKTDQPIALSCIFSTNQADAEAILSIIHSFPELTAQMMASWKDGTFDIHITHTLATKKHALQSLLTRLGVEPAQVMVAGDGGNDLPLFELAGWRVAMGNAEEKLKQQADWIAPTVDEDGLAVAIEKFILG